jgi:hypothetical protein
MNKNYFYSHNITSCGWKTMKQLPVILDSEIAFGCTLAAIYM